jgi:hypothetical protein
LRNEVKKSPGGSATPAAPLSTGEVRFIAASR